MPENLSASSLPRYIQIVGKVHEGWRGDGEYFDPWFRGQENAAWPLVPSLYRRELADEEEDIRAEFLRRGVQLLTEREPRNEWEWYFLMQHYGAPTRLLDWTTSSLVALFFALNSYAPGRPEPTTDAAVWMLDPWWLNGQVIRRQTVVLTDWPEARPYLPRLYEESLRRKLPLALDPSHIARRMAAQHGHFTIHGTNPNGLMELWKRPRSRLQKIVVPKRSIKKIRVDLYMAGVTDSAIFPDLEGLSREIIRYSTDPW